MSDDEERTSPDNLKELVAALCSQVGELNETVRTLSDAVLAQNETVGGMHRSLSDFVERSGEVFRRLERHLSIKLTPGPMPAVRPVSRGGE